MKVGQSVPTLTRLAFAGTTDEREPFEKEDWKDARHEVQDHASGECEQNGEDETRFAARSCRHRSCPDWNVEGVGSAAAQFQDALEPGWQLV